MITPRPSILPSLALVALLAAGIALAAAPAAHADTAADHLATFFVGRLAFGGNEGGDCGDVGQDLVKLVARASTIHVQEERKLKLSDDGLYETPFLFMNGHNDFTLSAAELANLRKYLEHGGFVFASGCCTNPEFPAAWRRELSRVFPGEKVQKIPYDHLLYRAFYKLDHIRSAHGNRDIYLEGLFHQGDLVAVIGEDGLCCSFSMGNSCNVGKGVAPEDAKKIAVNISVYALTH
ncbi:MAG TPA: DUF4159 domain-containing protein [Thermoanaerobaculia bacterium]